MDSKGPKICKRTPANSSSEIRELDREDGEEMITDANRDARNRHDVMAKTVTADTETHQTPQHAGSVCVRIRSSRAAAVCLVLLCVLLLTAVIVLCVELSTMIDKIHIKYKNFTEEQKELENIKLIILGNNTNLSKYYKTLIEEKKELQDKMKELWQKIYKMDGWKCYQSSLYFISTEKKNWTESRRDCTERGADLIIINNREEQEFLKSIPGGTEFWIGLTDREVEGSWKWVDDSPLTSGFWKDGEPSDGAEDCATSLSSGFAGYSCDKKFNWICENTF